MLTVLEEESKPTMQAWNETGEERKGWSCLLASFLSGKSKRKKNSSQGPVLYGDGTIDQRGVDNTVEMSRNEDAAGGCERGWGKLSKGPVQSR